MTKPVTDVQRILLINLAFIGDVLLSTPVTRALRTAWPEAQLDMLVAPLVEPVARSNPYVNDVLVYDKRGRHRKASELWKLAHCLRARRYDTAITMNFAPRGAMLAWAAGIPRRIGYDAQHAGWFLTQTSSAKRLGIQHETLNHLNVLRPLGVTTEDTSLIMKVFAV
jgi:ADP-heptose:LPS heptosyltransferase